MRKKGKKSEAVLETLQRLGTGAVPKAVRDDLQQHGIKVSLALINQVKKQHRANSRTSVKVERLGQWFAAQAAGAKTFSIEDISAVKKLADCIGTEKLQALADLLK